MMTTMMMMTICQNVLTLKKKKKKLCIRACKWSVWVLMGEMPFIKKCRGRFFWDALETKTPDSAAARLTEGGHTRTFTVGTNFKNKKNKQKKKYCGNTTLQYKHGAVSTPSNIPLSCC